MSERTDGGPAFPSEYVKHERGEVSNQVEIMAMSSGMSMRDWFAGQALVGILGGGFAGTIPHDDVNGGGDAAFFAYQYADAMIKARQTRK